MSERSDDMGGRGIDGQAASSALLRLRRGRGGRFVAAALCATAMAGALVGCVMYAPGTPYHYVSKLELGLNIPKIEDPAVRALAEEAKPDILRSLRVLSDQRLDREEAERQLGWTSGEALLLPPEWRMPLTPVEGVVVKRRPMAAGKVYGWASTDNSTVSFVVTFTDGLTPTMEIKERQIYRREGDRWRLVKQERWGAG